MNRRTYIRYFTFLGALGFTSFSFGACNWFLKESAISLQELPGYKPLLAEIAEVIIPRTETPGAKDAKVEDFIVLHVMDCSSRKDCKNFLKGLTELQDYTLKQYSCDFLQCDTHQKAEILRHFADKEFKEGSFIRKVQKKLFGNSFYIQIHSLTVQGYCTSFVGATEALSYDPIPGEYIGCYPLQPNQKSWAT